MCSPRVLIAAIVLAGLVCAPELLSSFGQDCVKASEARSRQLIENSETRLFSRMEQSPFELGPAFQIGGRPAYGPAARSQTSPAVAFDGTNYLVVWEHWWGWGRSVFGTRVSPDAIILDPAGIRIPPRYANSYGPAVAFDGTGYLVVWVDDGSAYVSGARVSTDGKVLDPNGIAILSGTSKSSPAIAFDGTNYMVVSNRPAPSNRGLGSDRARVTWDIYGTRVSPDGTVLDPDGIPISSAPETQGDPAIAFDGTNYMVVWADERSDPKADIWGARVSTDATVLDAEGIPISIANGFQEGPAVAFDGTNYVAVWGDSRSIFEFDIYGTRISPSGTALDPHGVAISTADARLRAPAIAFDGTNCMIVWVSGWPNSAIRGARVRPDAAVLDPEGIPISKAAHSNPAQHPAIAFDGSHYMIVWEDIEGAIHGTRVSPDGSVLDPDPIAVSTAQHVQRLPAVAPGNPGEMLVAYSSYTEAYHTFRIWGNLWAPDEKPPEITLSVHQNPELTAELGIYMVSSEAVQDTSVWLAVNDSVLSVSPTDTLRSIYSADYRITETGSASISARARDLAGNLADTSRTFGVGFVTVKSGGSVFGPWRRTCLTCAAGCVSKDSYLLILPDMGTETFPEDSVSACFSISPPTLELQGPAWLSVRLDSVQGWPRLWWLGPSGWQEVESSYHEPTETLSTLIRRLGRFRVTWDQSDNRPHAASLLLSPVPNPFRTAVDVQYHLPAGGKVHLAIYDAKGRLVKRLFIGEQGPGWHSESWDGSDDGGTAVPSGIYFTRVDTGSKSMSKKCVLIR